MEKISSTINLLKEGSYMASLDLQDVYCHVPIHKDCQQFLRIALFIGSDLHHFQFRALLNFHKAHGRGHVLLLQEWHLDFRTIRSPGYKRPKYSGRSLLRYGMVDKSS